MRVLLTGWFSFRDGEATAGDLLAMRVARGWLRDAGVEHDVGCSPKLGGGVDVERVDPARYTDVVFVCGPAHGRQLDRLRTRFRGSRLTYLDVSMINAGDSVADLVFERDSDRFERPDVSLVATSPAVPFVPMVRGHRQPEYGRCDGHAEADRTMNALLERHRLATVTVDTRVDPDVAGARHPSQIERLLALADAVVTSRLHGLVLSLKHDVPALAIDPVHGGGKVSAQARALHWPEVLTLDEATPDRVDRGLTRCLHPSARGLAARCRRRATEEVHALGEEFVAALTGTAVTIAQPRAVVRRNAGGVGTG